MTLVFYAVGTLSCPISAKQLNHKLFISDFCQFFVSILYTHALTSQSVKMEGKQDDSDFFHQWYQLIWVIKTDICISDLLIS